MSTPDVIDIDGRPAINRVEIMRRTGAARSTVDHWYAQRATNGHPAGQRRGRGIYFDEQAWTDWYEDMRQAQKAQLTEVDRSGNPDELVDAREAARILHYESANVIYWYLRNKPGYFAKPDETEPLPGGGQRRRWKRRTVWAFADRRTRTGGGRPSGTPGVRKDQPYADDPRMLAIADRLAHNQAQRASELATEFDVSERTASRLLAAARRYLTTQQQR